MRSSDTGPRSGETEKDNISLPQDKSKGVQNVVVNVENNMPNQAVIDTDGKLCVVNLYTHSSLALIYTCTLSVPGDPHLRRGILYL